MPPKSEAPEPSEAKWLAAAVLAAIATLALWFAARWLAIVPLALWASLHYAALDAVGMLDANGHAWRAYAQDLLRGTLNGTVPWRAVEWHRHLVPLQRDIAARIWPAWTALFGLGALVALFRTRGGGFRRRFTLTGQARQEAVRLGPLLVVSPFWRALLRPFALVLRRIAPRTVAIGKRWLPKGVSFLDYQSRYWRTTAAATSFGPDPATLPPPARTPAEWILAVFADADAPVPWPEAVRRMEKALAEQLGAPWQGLDAAPPHVRALAALALTNRREGEAASRRLAGDIALLFRRGVPKNAAERLRNAVPLLSDPEAIAKLDAWAAAHAWTNSAMLAIMGKGGPFSAWGGGAAGVLAPASYLWLKSVDRPLWYALNNIGRRAFHVEGAGAVAHFFAERALGKPLTEPMLAHAILAREPGSDRCHGIAGYLLDHGMLELGRDGQPEVLDPDRIRRILSLGQDA